MRFYTTQSTLRLVAITLFSIILASCGSGDGKSSVDVSQQETSASKLQLVFADYFGDPPATNSRGAKLVPKAALPLGNWVTDTGYGEDNDGWGNDEWQRYTNSMENVFTENGNLVLRAQCLNAPACGERDDSITSGKVTSKDRINVKFGNIRARIKMPSGGGMWPAFWTLGADIDERPWPDAGEIDIVEMHYYFSDNRTTHFSTHWAGPRYTDEEDRPDCSANVGAISSDEEEICKTENKTFEVEDGFPPLTNDFHIFELDWNEDVIIGKIDGIAYFTQAIDGSTMEEFLKDHYLILNVAVGGTLGGQQGPWMSADDWADPNQTDMLVDWVEVYERVPATSTTLIDESGDNLRYGKILNSVDFGGGLVETMLHSVEVPALVGNETMSIRFSNTFSGESGSRPVEFSSATFSFAGADLSDFDHFVFSVDGSRFIGFDHIGVQFADRNGGNWLLYTSIDTLTSVNGRWETHTIPLAGFTGVDMNNITFIEIINPHDVDHNLLAGTLYFDDIRFTGSPECNAVSSIEFDQLNYNPDTTVAAVYVNDPCAANRQVLVKAENALGEIFVPAKLDSAGNGRAIINLGKSEAEECLANDTTAVLKLTPPLMASYDRPMGAKGDANSSFATAGVDPGAPITTITGDSDYIISFTEPVSFIPEQDFKFSDFGTGSSFNGNFTGDATFSPVFQISNVPNILAQMALFEFVPGFTRSTGTIDMKVKDLPGNNITVKFGDTLGSVPESTYTVNVTADPESTSLGDGWYLVSVPMANFANPDSYNYVVFASDNNLPDAVSFLITDIVLQERVGNLPAECGIPPVPPVTGSGTGATGATGGPFSISFDDMAVTYSFIGFGNPDTINATNADPVDAANTVVQTTKLAGSQVWAGVTVQTDPGITWPLSVTESEITLRIYSPGPGVTVRMKLEELANAGNFVEIDALTTVDTGWETLTFDFGAPPAFTTDKLSLFFDFGNPGVGTVFTWDTIEFQGTGMSDGNLATNGDFEAADISGWTSAPGSGTIEAVNTQDSGSTWSGRMNTGMGNGAALSQANLAAGTVKTGDLIDISFDMCSSTQGDSGEFAIALLSNYTTQSGDDTADRQDLLRFNQNTVPTVWTRYNLQGIAGSNVESGVSLQFDAICGAVAGCGVEAFVDNVSITIGGGIVDGTASGEACETVGPPPPPPGTKLGVYSETNTDPVLNYTVIDNFGNKVNVDENSATVTPFDGSVSLSLDYELGGSGFGGAVLQFGGADLSAYGSLSFSINVTGVVDFGNLVVQMEPPGGGTPGVFVLLADYTAVSTSGDWASYEIPLTDFFATNFDSVSNLGFFNLVDSGGAFTAGTIYLDDIYYTVAPLPTEPQEAAPTPTPAEADVISIFSDVYTNIVGTNYNPNWNQATVTTEVDIVGNNTLKYAGLNYQGTVLGSWQDLVAAEMTDLHVDFWTADSTSLQIFLISETTGERAYTFTVTQGGWVSVDIPLSTFTDAGLGLTDIKELKFVGDGTVFLDNLYFHKSGGVVVGGNLAINGDFETGDFTGTEQFLNSGTQSISAVNPSSGQFSANLLVTAAQSDTLLKFANLAPGGFTPGQTIFIKFDMRGTLAPGGVAFVELFSEIAPEGVSKSDILFGGGPIFPNGNADTWTTFETTGVTGGVTTGGITVQLKAASGGSNLADLFFDNVCISTEACP